MSPDEFLRFRNSDMGVGMTNLEPTVGRKFLVRRVAGRGLRVAGVVCIRIRINTAQLSKDIL